MNEHDKQALIIILMRGLEKYTRKELAAEFHDGTIPVLLLEEWKTARNKMFGSKLAVMAERLKLRRITK